MAGCIMWASNKNRGEHEGRDLQGCLYYSIINITLHNNIG